MVLGVSRLRLWPRGRMMHPLPAAPALRARPVSPATEWVSERGEVLFEATCDVFGGFPGFAAQGGRLPSARLRITERYLLVEEREPHGFGLPISWLEGVITTPLTGPDDPGLRILYRDDYVARLFTVRLRSGLGGRGGRRADRMRDALLLAGMRPDLTERQLPEPAFHLSWEEAAQYESENVIWTGRASAPLRVGLPAVPSEIWLTTRSLIWGSEAGDGLNRLPLPMLTDVLGAQLDDRRSTPAVYVGIGDETTGRFDLPFIFDQLPHADLNFRERGAFLVGLRSRGVPYGAPAPLMQPWRGPVRRAEAAAATHRATGMPESTVRLAEAPEPPATETRAVTPAAPPNVNTSAWQGIDTPAPNVPRTLPVQALSPDAAVQGDHERLSDTMATTDIVLSEWTAPAEPVEDVPVAATWTDGASSKDAVLGTQSEPAQNNAAAAAAWDIVRAYEAAAVAVFDASRQMAESRTSHAVSLGVAPPPATQQAAALAALVDLANMGHLSRDELQRRSARLVALGEAAIRLHALVELHDAGHISDEELAKKRADISSQLIAAIANGEHTAIGDQPSALASGGREQGKVGRGS